MPDKSEAFDEVFKEFYDELKGTPKDPGKLASDGMTEFVRVYERSIGKYLDCKKVGGSTVDYWTDPDFRRWALVSARRVGKAVRRESKSMPAKQAHVRKGAEDVFKEIGDDPNEHCNKSNLPHCESYKGTPRGPVCELYFAP